MLTKKDRQSLIDDFSEIFVTKDEFQQEIAQLKNSMIQSFDTVMGELKSMREEIAMLFYRQREHSDQLENHEQRMRQVELSVLTPKKE